MFEKAKDMYKLQKQARKIKKELKNTHIEAEHEGVTVTINGEQEIIKIEISDEALKNKKKLEDSLLKATNKAIKKSQQIGAEMMKDVMGDLNIPGMG
ncbi:MAG: YbaB/EbfC family nucleoid-associated protein [Nitrospirae bacterium]|nr:YbaB/EbfC family nucleoid-associated protein [Nitrospirota bacterium]